MPRPPSRQAVVNGLADRIRQAIDDARTADPTITFSEVGGALAQILSEQAFSAQLDLPPKADPDD